MRHRCPYCEQPPFETVDGMEAHAERCAEVEIPCPMCSGRGTQHLHGASFSGDEMEEMGQEFREDYAQGMYEHPCDHCQGRKVTTRGSWQYHLEVEAERRVGA